MEHAMSNDALLQYLKEMEQRLMTKIEDMQKDIIDDMETNLMELGVYKKEILESINKLSKPSK